MSFRRVSAARNFVLATALIVGSTGSAHPRASPIRQARNGPFSCALSVSPNVQISDHSKNSTSYVFEQAIAINPKDERNLLLATIAIHKSDKGKLADFRAGSVPEIYYSLDRGKSWARSLIQGKQSEEFAAGRKNHEYGFVHPLAVFDKQGNGIVSFDNGVSTLFAKSSDGGRDWADITQAGSSNAQFRGIETFTKFDRGNVAADRTGSAFDGNIYITALSPQRKGPWDPTNSSYPTLHVYSDARQTWSRKIYATPSNVNAVRSVPRDTGGVYTSLNVLVGAGGRLLIPFIAGTIPTDYGRPSNFTTSWGVTSDDGGNSFSAPFPIVTSAGEPLGGDDGLAATYAIDASKGRFSNRVYRVWAAQTLNGDGIQVWELRFSSSSDGGRTWLDPKVLEVIESPSGIMTKGSYASALQALPVVAVNNAGHVFVSWYRFKPDDDAPDGAKTFSYQRVVTASVDGGLTFLHPEPLATEPTRHFRPPNGLSPGDPLANGDLGHFMRVDVDTGSRLHAAWFDGRTGKQELWYSQVALKCRGLSPKRFTNLRFRHVPLWSRRLRWRSGEDKWQGDRNAQNDEIGVDMCLGRNTRWDGDC